MLTLSVFALAGCGGGTHFADKAHPPTPVDLTVYIGNSRVSVSPSSVGAGPVMFVITNQAGRAVMLAVRPAAGGAAVATTAPINPQATSSVSVDFRPGDYTLDTRAAGGEMFSGAASITPASLHVGSARRSGNNALLAP
jgi:hypothetical protein